MKQSLQHVSRKLLALMIVLLYNSQPECHCCKSNSDLLQIIEPITNLFRIVLSIGWLKYFQVAGTIQWVSTRMYNQAQARSFWLQKIEKFSCLCLTYLSQQAQAESFSIFFSLKNINLRAHVLLLTFFDNINL